MRKISILMSIAAVALASCSSEEFTGSVPTPAPAAEQPMSFFVANKNMGRANDLQNQTFCFGVWAYKATAYANINPSATNTSLVMQDYLVGYNGRTEGYIPTGSQATTSPWIYDLYGNDQDDNGNPSYNFVAKAGVQDAVINSLQPKQYLKYWDATAGMKTFFFAAAPYNATSAITDFDPSTYKLTLNGLEMAIGQTDDADIYDTNSQANWMYAFTAADNADYKGASPSKTTVPLNFIPMGAKIRLAFYEVVNGYQVEVIPYSATNGKDHIYAVPTKRSGAGTDAVPYTYAKGKYTYKYGNVEVDFTDPTAITYAAVNDPGDDPKTSNNIIAPLYMYDKDGTHVTSNIMGTSNTDMLYSGWKKVVPAQGGADANDGFTLNVSLKFIAEDTGEVIYVKGARVFVPADKCQWEANHVYTYVFKITHKAGGQPTDPDDPDPTPTPDPALNPIVFDNVTVQAEVPVTVSPEYPINPAE